MEGISAKIAQPGRQFVHTRLIHGKAVRGDTVRLNDGGILAGTIIRADELPTGSANAVKIVKKLHGGTARTGFGLEPRHDLL